MTSSPDLPDVSVIVPCYRQAHFLGAAIRSLQAQTCEDWEAIVVDDGSPDDTHDIAQSLRLEDGRVRYLRKANGGLSSARNAGLRVARGSLIQFLDADDCLAPRKFENAIAFLRAHPSVDIVYTSAYYFTDTPGLDMTRGPYAKAPDHDWMAEAWCDARPMLAKLMERNILPVCAPVIRATAARRIGDFDESLRALEDWDYWVRAALAGVRFQHVQADADEALIRWHGQSMTRDRQRIRQAAYRFRLLNQQRIAPGMERERNFLELLRVAALLGDDGRDSRYAEIERGCRSWSESLRTRLCARFDRGGAQAGAARRVVHRLPRRVRHWLSDQGLRFATH